MNQVNWRQALADASRQSIEKTRRALLLSQVPGVLRASGFDPAAISQGRKILELLREDSEGCYQLVQNDANATLWAVLPPDFEVEHPTSQYFPSPTDPKPSDNIPRFPSRFWHAFHSSLAPGLRRWLYLGDHVDFKDVPEQQQPEMGLEVERDFTRDPTAMFTTNELTYTKVQEWAAQHNIDLLELVSFAPSREVGEGGGRKALENFLHHLKPQERAKITLPADVIARLLGV